MVTSLVTLAAVWWSFHLSVPLSWPGGPAPLHAAEAPSIMLYTSVAEN